MSTAKRAHHQDAGDSKVLYFSAKISQGNSNKSRSAAADSLLTSMIPLNEGERDSVTERTALSVHNGHNFRSIPANNRNATRATNTLSGASIVSNTRLPGGRKRHARATKPEYQFHNDRTLLTRNRMGRSLSRSYEAHPDTRRPGGFV